MSGLPEPLTPADCDLRGLAFMPLDVVRLLDSDLYALSSGEEFKAALTLWCKAWLQVPAGSVPDDDRILAHLSGAGIRWKRVKDVALRGWVKCADGRLYHPTVAEKAKDALPHRQEYRARQSSTAERKAKERDNRRALFTLLRENGVTPEYNTKTSHLRELAAPFQPNQSHEKVTESHESHTPVTPDVTAKREIGRGRGRGIPPSPPQNVTPKLPEDVRAVMEAGGFVTPPPDLGLIDSWKQAGADMEQDVLPTMRAVAKSVKERTGRAPFKLQLFDQPIRDKLSFDDQEIERLRSIAVRYTPRCAGEEISG